MAYTTQKTFPARTGGPSYQLSILANSGSVDVEYPVGAGWATAQSITADGAFIVSAISEVRITPTGGAEYDVR